MKKLEICDCCGVKTDRLSTRKDFKLCPSCYMGFVSIPFVNVIKNYKQRIAELEKDNNRLHKCSFAIYCALADILTKENPKHVPSRIDQLTGEYLAEYADMWQGYKLKNSRIEKLEEENAKLKEQLKNGIFPKYKKGDKVYILCPRGVKIGKITQIYYDTISGKMPIKENIAINYDVAFGVDDEMNYFEKEVFPTEAEAQKYLEKK